MAKPSFVVITFEPIGPSYGRAIGKISYGFCEYLHKNGYDVKYYVINKGPFNTTFPSESVHWLTRYLLSIMNLIFRINIFKNSFRRNVEEWMFDYFLSKKSLRGDYLLTTSPFINKTLKKHSKNFRKIIFLPANPNETEIASIYRSELELFGNANKYDDAYYNPYREHKFRKTLPFIDKVVAISEVTEKSYLKENKELVHVPFVYIPQSRPNKLSGKCDHNKIKFLYVAYSVPLKGLHRLIREWKTANIPNAELNIVGEISENYASVFDLSLTPNIFLLGPKFPPDEEFMATDIVVIPSLLDNEPTTAIEALQFRKPVIISETCGYANFIGKFVPEAVTDIYQPGAFAGKMKYFANNLDIICTKFQPAFEYVENNQFDIDDFFRKIGDACMT